MHFTLTYKLNQVFGLMIRNHLSPTVSILLALFTASCQNPYEQLKADAKRFSSISKERTIGSVCSETDSATVKRAEQHPLGPTGGWLHLASLDLSRSADTATNTFRIMNGAIVGYVKFETDGVIKARSYDDTYGAVYCGWSLNSLSYTPQKKAVYLRTGHCVVGDGGLAQVTEICWFPAGGKEGTIVYSTAHDEQSLKDEYLFYSKDDIGVISSFGGKKRYHYQNFQAERIFRSILVAGKRKEGHGLVLDTLKNFEFLEGAVDGSTRQPIPPKVFHSRDWKTLLLMKAGFELFEPSAIEALDEATNLVNDERACFGCETAKDLVPLYRWLAATLSGPKQELPNNFVNTKNIHGYDPKFIAKVLSDPTLTDGTLKKFDFSVGGETTYFWIGVREFISGNYSSAEKYLRKYLAEPNRGDNYFELSSTLTLLEKIEEKFKH